TSRKDDQEIAHYEAVIALSRRYPPDGRKTPMFGAVLASPDANRGPVPEPPNGARRAAQAYLEAGRWYQPHNRPADARRCWEAASALGVHPGNAPIPRPNIGDGKGDDNFSDKAGRPSGEALIELAKIELQKKNYKAAFDLLQAAT